MFLGSTRNIHASIQEAHQALFTMPSKTHLSSPQTTGTQQNFTFILHNFQMSVSVLQISFNQMASEISTDDTPFLSMRNIY